MMLRLIWYELLATLVNMRGMNDDEKCPVMHGAHSTNETGMKNADWWPNQLNLAILHQHDKKSNPMDENLITKRLSIL